MIKFIFLAFILLVTTKASAKLEKKNTKHIQAVMQKVLEEYIQENEPGCSIAYGNNQQTIFYSMGLANLKSKQPLSQQSQMLTASISKQFTAHAAIKLEQNGTLDLDSNIADILPTFKKNYLVSPRQLMNHSSGIAEHWSLFELQGKSINDHFSQLQAYQLATQTDFLEFKPGQQFSYSNGGYAVLAKLIESSSGKSLNKNLEETTFNALNISASFLINESQNISQLAQGYIKSKNGFLSINPDSYIYGGGNLIINTNDFAIWAKYLNNELITNKHYIEGIKNSANNYNYFAGLFIDKNNNEQPLIHHGGYYEHNSQDIVLLPDTQEFALALCNRSDFRPAKLTRSLLKQIASIKATTDQFVIKNSINKQPLTPGLYFNQLENKTALIFNENDDNYFYGFNVSSPKKLTAIAINTWQSQLSTQNITLVQAHNNIINVIDNQSSVSLNRVEFIANPFPKLNKTITYKNTLIGEISFTFAKQPLINFIHSVGEITLQCTSNKICFSEDGYVIVNATDPKNIVISTQDLQNLIFTE